MDDRIISEKALSESIHELEKQILLGEWNIGHERVPKREIKRCPICGSLPRYWGWNHGAIIECWCQDHRIQCEAKTLDEAIKAWERRR